MVCHRRRSRHPAGVVGMDSPVAKGEPALLCSVGAVFVDAHALSRVVLYCGQTHWLTLTWARAIAI